ncbi:MAG: hypothetical protein ILNGONEN_00785 [Syntrophorhabdaceae bacterium]|nr:hypothetical protein [Syntrophorhabdaceae bacterium]
MEPICMSENMINLIINSVVALAGVGLGNLLGHLSNKKSSRDALNLVAKQEFIKAAAEFQSAFTEAEIALKRPFDYTEANKTTVIIRNAAIQHKNAMIKFRPYLDESKRIAFDEAWKEYDGENKYEGVHNVAIAKRQLALDNIKRLLEFAKL